LENAVQSVCSKNNELKELVETLTVDPSARIDRLSMALAGILDAAVNGGTAKYQEAFFSPHYRMKNKDKKDLIARLEREIVEQFRIVGWALTIHGEQCNENLFGLHAHMESTRIP